MKRSILRNLSLCTRRRLPPVPSNPTTPSPSSSFSVFCSTTPTTTTTRFFSSRNTPSPQPHFPNTNDNDNNNNDPIDVEDISNEELKRRVAKLKEGDAEAIPSLFEAILQRYLAGKPIDDDEELMREILGKGTLSDNKEEDDDDDDGVYSSSSEETSDTDSDW